MIGAYKYMLNNEKLKESQARFRVGVDVGGTFTDTSLTPQGTEWRVMAANVGHTGCPVTARLVVRGMIRARHREYGHRGGSDRSTRGGSVSHRFAESTFLS